MLMIVERTVVGLIDPGTIEEMEKELTKVIEDFDRAVNVENLRLAKETGKFLFTGDRIFSILSCRARSFPLAAQVCRGWL